MKKTVTTLVLSLSALMAASAAMADPYYDRHDDRYRDRVIANQHHDWREGARFPDHYHDNRYYVNDYRSYNRLNKPGRFERWYKVDGRYVLVNERTHHVIRVVR